MSTAPSISVLLPVWNAEPYLEECLQSLAVQSWTDFEVVAVDDGSDDGSSERLTDWQARDARFRLVRLPHQGLVTALNAGLDRCRGELVARMDADDVTDPRRLELQANLLRQDPSLDLVACLVRHFPDESVGQGYRIYEEWLNNLVEHDDILRERFVESPMPHPAVMARRRVLAEAGGYRETGGPEDYDLWLRLAAAGKRFCKVPEYLYFWREHPDRLTRTDSRYAVERFLACKAHHLARGPLVGRERVIVWGAGQTGRRLSKHLIREGVPLQAFIDIDPAKVGRTLRGLPIRLPAELPQLTSAAKSCVILAAVSSRGARKLIRNRLGELGYSEAEDFWCVA
ncbi:MAG: glycosyltransferase [Thermoanaerobaculia bacterium]